MDFPLYDLSEVRFNLGHLSLCTKAACYCDLNGNLFEFPPNVFTEIAEFSNKIFVITVKGLKPATQLSCVYETRLLPQYQEDTCERQDL